MSQNRFNNRFRNKLSNKLSNKLKHQLRQLKQWLKSSQSSQPTVPLADQLTNQLTDQLADRSPDQVAKLPPLTPLAPQTDRIPPSSPSLPSSPLFQLPAHPATHQPPSSRYEIKIVGDRQVLPQLKSWLNVHPAAFRRAYPHRQVNNIYFDTPHLNSYMENLSGVGKRRKLRLRWYGDRHNSILGTMELKGKDNNLGWKRSQKLNHSLNLTNGKWSDILNHIRTQLNPEFRLYLGGASWAILFNRYQRQYYVSFNQKVRITIDRAMLAYDQRLSPNPNLRHHQPPSDRIVIEIKADREYYQLVAEIAASFPLRVTKHSKYGTAIEELFN